ncbi:hypothetical protein HMI54_004796 [Coelomomyces lativittatus]|nr:hypothetical protein HMI56_001962 [Coelomomyces lativittatus]KAJ1517657.1 hypothetical protein HMI54_004796 [Coelomomyces lativittatus]
MESVLVPPLNFAMVCSGVYRSGYPNRKNFTFLKTLQLKTLIYVCPESYAEENQRFAEENQIQVFHYQIKSNKEPYIEMKEKDVLDVLEKILDPAHRPILLHCNKGKQRVGCIVGCLRLLQHWSLSSIFDEYRKFSGDKPRMADQEFMELFPIDKVQYQWSKETDHSFPGILWSVFSVSQT